MAELKSDQRLFETRNQSPKLHFQPISQTDQPRKWELSSEGRTTNANPNMKELSNNRMPSKLNDRQSSFNEESYLNQ
jgi:hypothetical protein